MLANTVQDSLFSIFPYSFLTENELNAAEESWRTFTPGLLSLTKTITTFLLNEIKLK